MRLVDYLTRIGYQGEVKPNFDTLKGIHRAHLLTIPYENLDIHRRCPLTVDTAQIYDKIVTGGRGGWCFEMNGLLAWALREVGFDVALLSSFVGRDTTQPLPAGAGDHLILLVKLDRPYLADAGFGNGILDPLPLAEGTYQQGLFQFGLTQHAGRWWFTNQEHGGPGFDFDLQPYRLEDFSDQSTRLQTSPESGFVRTTVCMRFTADGGLWVMRGAVLQAVGAHGVESETIDNAVRYTAVLQEQFGLHLPDVDALWETVWARHQAWTQERK